MYKKDVDNNVANALSRKPVIGDKHLRPIMQSSLQPLWMNQVISSYKGNNAMTDIISHLPLMRMHIG